MEYILYTTHVLTCIFLILVVLLQQGKGADLSVFGGGGTMTAFGARGAATFLSKATTSAAVLFMVTSLALSILSSGGGGGSGSVLDEVAPQETTTETAPVEPAAEGEVPAALPEEATSEEATEPVPEESGE